MATIPSLALIPSGVKASKVYSVLPTDGVEILTSQEVEMQQELIQMV
jgi:hypothetical protein